MTEILYGTRFGGQGLIRLGCCAVIFDPSREKVLLTRRADNGQWCLPSGGAEPGESVSETCIRETFEETGLQIKVNHLVGLFSDPDRLVIYADGNKFQFVILAFEAEPVGGVMGLSNETTEVGYFPISAMTDMDIFPHHRQFVLDALVDQDAPFIR